VIAELAAHLRALATPVRALMPSIRDPARFHWRRTNIVRIMVRSARAAERGAGRKEGEPEGNKTVQCAERAKDRPRIATASCDIVTGGDAVTCATCNAVSA
jgi:hypothetical protein